MLEGNRVSPCHPLFFLVGGGGGGGERRAQVPFLQISRTPASKRGIRDLKLKAGAVPILGGFNEYNLTSLQEIPK